jgi:hypothetical protein
MQFGTEPKRSVHIWDCAAELGNAVSTGNEFGQQNEERFRSGDSQLFAYDVCIQLSSTFNQQGVLVQSRAWG